MTGYEGHTPGPWKIVLADLYKEGDHRNDKLIYIVSEKYGLIGEVDVEGDEDSPPGMVGSVERLDTEGGLPDARLIAAAPDLLTRVEALETALAEIHEGTGPDRIGRYEYLRDWVHKTSGQLLNNGNGDRWATR